MPYAKRSVLAGFPKSERFKTAEEIGAYLGEDKVTCLLCGHRYKILETHLRNVHEMTGRDYRELYDLPFTRGLCGAGFSEQKVILGKGMYEENQERQDAALQKAKAVQRKNGNPQVHKPVYWRLQMSGIQNKNAKLTPEKVAAIRLDGRANPAIAAEYGVTVQAVWHVKNKKTWKSV